MGLRDAIDDGLAEIHQTAQKLILSLKIKAKIKNAVVISKNSILINLPQGDNLYVIHEEMIKQIEDQGFSVKYTKPCCANPIFLQNNRLIKPAPGSKSGEKRIYWMNCRSCKERISTADSKQELTPPFFGLIEIAWNLNNESEYRVCSCGYDTHSKASYFQHKEHCKG